MWVWSSAVFGFLAVTIAAQGSAPQIKATSLRVTPLEGDPVVISNWSIADQRLRGRRNPSGEAWSLSLRRVWTLDMVAARSAVLDTTGPCVQLRKGPLLAAKVTGGGDCVVALDLGPLGKSEVKTTFIQGIRFQAKLADAGADKGFEEALTKPPADDDLVFRLTDKGKVRRFRCHVADVSNERIVIERAGQRGELPSAQVYGVVFAETSGLEAQLPEDRWTSLTMRDGRRLRGMILGTGASQTLRFELLEGLRLDIPIRLVQSLEMFSDKLVYLSSIETENKGKGSALGRRWPVLRDRGLAGAKLHLGAKSYRRGLLIVPPAKLTFKLPRRYDRLIGEVGMPAARFGSARLRFLADGKQVGLPMRLAADGKPAPLVLPLGRASEVVVELTATEDLDVGARVVLGNLRVVRD